MLLMLTGCTAKAGDSRPAHDETASPEAAKAPSMRFDADSAYLYVQRQVEFGPRVPNSEPHARTAAWLASELRRHGAQVEEQSADLKAFDGTVLKSVNIFGRFNPEASDRLLLLAHYDTRPWADQDPDPGMRQSPSDGANDGASGVGVLLEVARQLSLSESRKGVDILFVDAEDYGTDGDEDSWALGARHFAATKVKKEGYRPSAAVLLDMVGGTDAVFPAEYFSRQAAASVDDALRHAAARAGHAGIFPKTMGSAVTDDHVQLIEAGVPAIDIIDYRAGNGFCPTWHTSSDNLSNISKATLKAVGETLMEFIGR